MSDDSLPHLAAELWIVLTQAARTSIQRAAEAADADSFLAVRWQQMLIRFVEIDELHDAIRASASSAACIHVYAPDLEELRATQVHRKLSREEYATVRWHRQDTSDAIIEHLCEPEQWQLACWIDKQLMLPFRSVGFFDEEHSLTGQLDHAFNLWARSKLDEFGGLRPLADALGIELVSRVIEFPTREKPSEPRIAANDEHFRFGRAQASAPDESESNLAWWDNDSSQVADHGDDRLRRVLAAAPQASVVNPDLWEFNLSDSAGAGSGATLKLAHHGAGETLVDVDLLAAADSGLFDLVKAASLRLRAYVRSQPADTGTLWLEVTMTLSPNGKKLIGTCATLSRQRFEELRSASETSCRFELAIDFE